MSNLPVSALIRQSNQFGAEDGMESGKRKSKDEYRKQKDLEEQRKAGTAPAMVDVETGRDINPHIPEFIEKTPWYIPHSGPTLKHQRPHEDRQKEYSTLAEWYPKGTTDRVAFKYRDGACENCGAMGHSKKNCFEKPRTVGAKWTNSNIAPDDYNLPKLELGWDAKRDRWNGYNPDDYKLVVQEFEKMDETRKLIRTEQLKETGEEEKLEQLEEQDEDIYAEDASAPGQSVDMDSRTRITVRNLRIREDTAKYLYSLDTNGPYYDPKSRSMRENPFKGVPGKEQEAAQFSGENFARFTGEVAEANEAQVFAWQARCKGIDVHSLAEPTRLEALKKEFEKQKEHSKSSVQNELLEKYGGEEHLSAPPKELLLAQSENYVEYNRKGKVIKGDERPAAKSKYTEDALINNHTAIWGSYWRDSRWGYACCHQFLRNSYCIGEQGILVERAELGPPMADRRAAASASGVQLHQQNSAGHNNKATLSTEMEKAMKTLETIEEEEAAPKRKTVKVKEKDDGKAAAAKRDKNDGDDEHSSNSSASSADEKSASEEEEEEMDEEERQRYEEQLEKEKQKKLRDDKRREARRDKRRRRKEKAKQREGEKNKKKSSSKKDGASSGSGSSSGGTESDDSSSSGDEDATTKSKKYPKELKKAIKKQLKQKAEGKALANKGDRKRKYHRGLEDQEQQQKPSDVDREAYNLTRIHSADPMARFFEEKEEQKRTTTKTKKTRVE